MALNGYRDPASRSCTWLSHRWCGRSKSRSGQILLPGCSYQYCRRSDTSHYHAKLLATYGRESRQLRVDGNHLQVSSPGQYNLRPRLE
jgi:hypothetical protein